MIDTGASSATIPDGPAAALAAASALAALLAAALLSVARTAPAQSVAGRAEARPNVVLIMTDDQGYGDFGFTGNPLIRTPNLDALARTSARIESFYVHPVCSPTRACLMTGRYNYRTRAIDTFVGRAMLEPDEVTIAEVLRTAGYATGIFGKWHLGDCYPMRAIDQGFEEAWVHRGGGIGQPADPPDGRGKYTDPVLFHNGREVPTEGYCTDVFFDRATEWIEREHGHGRSFFAYIATNAPHGPFHDVPPDLLRSYRELDLGNERFPQATGHPPPAKADLDVRARIYAMITNIDAAVGRLLGKLDDLGLAEDTLLIFLTDNGPDGRRFVAGMKGRKGTVHEGGIRTPLLVRWPAQLAAGRTSNRIAAHIDILPTILAACGVAPPPGIRLDGRDLLPLLRGEDADWPDRTLFIQSHRGDQPVRFHNFAARSQRFKLVHPSGFGRETFTGDPTFELYDMQADPLETRDVAEAHPDEVARLRRAYEQWFDDVGHTRPDNYAPPRIHVGTPHERPTVLTRQDWRHDEGQPWAERSNGHWELHVEAAGDFDIRLRYLPGLPAPEGEATLHIAGASFSARAAGTVLFERIHVDAGDFRLHATPPPWQVDVILVP